MARRWLCPPVTILPLLRTNTHFAPHRFSAQYGRIIPSRIARHTPSKPLLCAHQPADAVNPPALPVRPPPPPTLASFETALFRQLFSRADLTWNIHLFRRAHNPLPLPTVEARGEKYDRAC